jgi:hypothetical protein
MIKFFRNFVAGCCYGIATLIGMLALLIGRIAQDTAELGLRIDPSVIIIKKDDS